METITTILDLLQKAALLGGGIWSVWGAIVLAGGLKDHSGPQTQSGIWQLVGGAVIITAAALFSTLSF
ncbi:hypothetical protein [Bifidobacterium tissieri]|uniref:hypothetical protein n=1 Tax=Bifidobacterium tissieri TaxID=1630162 RepID=UPI00123B0E8D|nr:hypothetical protein [Bifidobacterium tissieri]KAA8830172.1 hypothetical protein EM849_10360 [Bifidobacterium tissieri]